MSLLVWLVLGAVSGWIATMVMGTNGNLVWDLFLGIIGAMLGGYLMNLLGQPGVSGLNLYSIIVAVVGAIVLISIGRILRRA